jgi:hypothetical protein
MRLCPDWQELRQRCVQGRTGKVWRRTDPRPLPSQSSRSTMAPKAKSKAAGVSASSFLDLRAEISRHEEGFKSTGKKAGPSSSSLLQGQGEKKVCAILPRSHIRSHSNSMLLNSTHYIETRLGTTKQGCEH